jgi:putative glutamine amidotransferase
VDDYAQWLDGLVMHGGADVWPGSYGEQPLRPEWHGDRVRDEYEIALVKAFSAAGKPVFGICRGLQLINVAHGGTLYQDISTQKPGALVHRDAAAYDLNFHQVDILPGQPPGQLLPPGRHKINSVHHQGIKDRRARLPGRGVSPEDGVVEAIRHTGDALGRRRAMAPRIPPARAGRRRRHAAAARLPGGRARGPQRMSTLSIHNPATAN